MKILRIGWVVGGFLSLVLSMSAQTFTQLLSFDSTDGSDPAAALIQATNGNFYGTTSYNGGCGTVFGMTPAGKLTTLYALADPPDGCQPGGLVQGANGNFYGTTYGGGVPGFLGGVASGTVFEVTPRGMFKTVYEFCKQQDQYGYCTDGAGPEGSLLLGTDGNFYGTTSQGTHGSYNYIYDGGTVFRITPSGVLTTLHIFCPDGICATGEGNVPQGALIQGTDGNFYGTTLVGGTGGGDYGGGTVFRITPSGELTTLHSFCQSYGNYNCNDGTTPKGALIQGSDGNFYGTTYSGGPGSQYGYGQGTVFKITPTGTWTMLYGFEGPDGSGPQAALIQLTDGNFYGTTAWGGANCGNGTRCGTVFEITPSGTLTTLYNFCSQIGQGGVCTDGGNSTAALVQATNGSLYGTTYQGGANNYGTVFSLAVGLSAFPRVTLSTTSLSFGNEALNDTSAAKTMTVTNTGSATLNISSITASDNFAIPANTCGATLAVKKSCKVSVTFTPTVLGKLTGTLTFTDNAPNSPQVVALSGTGIAPATLTPASATYATQAVGTTSAAKTFTLSNNQTVTLSSIVISTTGDFAVSATTCTTSLAAKGKCTISVTFTPTETGTRTGELSVSDSASNSPQTSSLTGTGK